MDLDPRVQLPASLNATNPSHRAATQLPDWNQRVLRGGAGVGEEANTSNPETAAERDVAIDPPGQGVYQRY